MVRLSAIRTGRFYPRKYSWYSFLLDATVRPEGLRQWKIPSGIEPATFRLVAQCLNQLRYGVSHTEDVCGLDIVHDVRPTFLKVISRWEFVKTEHLLVLLLNIVTWCRGVISTRRKNQWPLWWCTFCFVGRGHWTGEFCFSHRKFLWTLYQL